MFLTRLLKSHPRVIISHRNRGLGDNLLAAANAWYYARNTNRSLVVSWQHSLYLANKSENAFTRFFKVPENIEGVPVIAEPRIDTLSSLLILHPYFFSPAPDPSLILYKVLSKAGAVTDNTFKRRMQRRQEEADRIINNLMDVRRRIIITHGCYGPNHNLKPFFDALELRAELKERADDFAEGNFTNKKIIGVHIRYYNKNMPLSEHTKHWLDQSKALAACLDKIKRAAAGFKESEYVVFLCTDSRMVHDFLTQSIGNVITYQKEFGSDGSKELHQELPVETAAASLIEMFLLAKSDVLVRFPAWSWFSHYASLYAKKIIT